MIRKPLTMLVGAVLLIAGGIVAYALLSSDNNNPADTTGAGGEIDTAQQVLMRYFSLLHNSQYAEAATLYGGSYDVLWDWNPLVNPTDHATLLEQGCTANGLRCLDVGNVLSSEQTDMFRFAVQFANSDGSLFVLYPEPGISLPLSTFEFTVVKVGDGYRVMELPVYVA